MGGGAPRVKRRLGSTPIERLCARDATCPDIFELEDGRVAVIGTEMTESLKPNLPHDAGVAAYERIVVIPRATLMAAQDEISKLR